MYPPKTLVLSTIGPDFGPDSKTFFLFPMRRLAELLA